MVLDKFNMVDMGGIDLILMQGEDVPGLYDKLMAAISNCQYQCLYNWLFDGVLIPPTYVQLTVVDDEVYLNEGVSVTSDNVIHIYTIEPQPPEPVISPITITENGTYEVPTGIDGYGPIVVNVQGGTNMDYSLEEIRIGTWIDGKPLYQKVVSYTNVVLGNTPSNKVLHGISDIDFAFMYDLFFKDENNAAYGGTYGNAIGGTRGANSIYNNMWVVDSTGFWSAATDVFNAQTTRTFLAVIRYTKTTDTI